MKWPILLSGLLISSCLTDHEASVYRTPDSILVQKDLCIPRPEDLPDYDFGYRIIGIEDSKILAVAGSVSLDRPKDIPEFTAVAVEPRTKKPDPAPVRRDESTTQKGRSESPSEIQSGETAKGGEIVTESLTGWELSAKKGKPFSVVMPEKGWLYLPDSRTASDIRFMDKQYTAEGTQFIFQITSGDSHLLTFERQDNTTGKKQTRQIRILLDGAQIVTQGDQTSVPADSYLDGMPSVLQLDAAVAAKDLKTITEILLRPEGFDGIDPLLLFKAWRLLETSSGDETLRSNTLDYLLDLYPNDPDITPELLFFRARLLEANTEMKNLKKAYALYDRVYRDYPVSRWSGKAKERMIYLDRHFFTVR